MLELQLGIIIGAASIILIDSILDALDKRGWL